MDNKQWSWLPFNPKGYTMLVYDGSVGVDKWTEDYSLGLTTYIDHPGAPKFVVVDDMKKMYMHGIFGLSGVWPVCVAMQQVHPGWLLFHPDVYDHLKYEYEYEGEDGYIGKVLDYISSNGGNVVAVFDNPVLSEPYEPPSEENLDGLDWEVLDRMSDFIDLANERNLSVYLRFTDGPGWIYKNVLLDWWNNVKPVECVPLMIAFSKTNVDEKGRIKTCYPKIEYIDPYVCVSDPNPDTLLVADELGWPNVKNLYPIFSQRRAGHVARVIYGIQVDRNGNPRYKTNLFAISAPMGGGFYPHLEKLVEYGLIPQCKNASLDWKECEMLLTRINMDTFISTVKNHPLFREVESNQPPLLFTVGVESVAPDIFDVQEAPNVDSCWEQSFCL